VLVSTGAHTVSELGANGTVLANYAAVFKLSHIGNFIFNSIFISFFAVLAALAMSSSRRPSAIVGIVCPTLSVPGISRSGTILKNLNAAVVGANEPMPSVSKKLVTKPVPSSSADSRGVALVMALRADASGRD
jgi:hypothetical protein